MQYPHYKTLEILVIGEVLQKGQVRSTCHQCAYMTQVYRRGRCEKNMVEGSVP